MNQSSLTNFKSLFHSLQETATVRITGPDGDPDTSEPDPSGFHRSRNYLRRVLRGLPGISASAHLPDLHHH